MHKQTFGEHFVNIRLAQPLLIFSFQPAGSTAKNVAVTKMCNFYWIMSHSFKGGGLEPMKVSHEALLGYLSRVCVFKRVGHLLEQVREPNKPCRIRQKSLHWQSAVPSQLTKGRSPKSTCSVILSCSPQLLSFVDSKSVQMNL